MKLLRVEDLRAHVNGFISEKKQISMDSFDLTVSEIKKIVRGGDIDFGGSEYKPGELQSIIPQKRVPDDKYGWWDLEPGAYSIIYNETIHLDKNMKGLIQMHTHMLLSSAYHPSIIIVPDEEVMIPLYVQYRVSIKENARVSRLFLWRT